MRWHTAMCLVTTCSASLTFSCVGDYGDEGDFWDDDYGRGWGGGGGGIFGDDDDDDWFGDRRHGRGGGNDFEGRLSDGARMFLGVPYAAAPTGDLRFRSPQPYVNESEDVLKVTDYAPRCAQGASKIYGSAASDSEDCLYMNIFGPETQTVDKLPVMVFLHGGDHANGSASDLAADGKTPVYDGATLAKQQNVVVATINYRLGAFGFYPDPELEAEDGVYGNQGLRDQVYALKWIKDNIEGFGGDPNNVTLMGQGSGGTDVCFHMASRESRGLFQQAISESGGCTDRQLEPEDLLGGLQTLSSKLGCDGESDVLKCMRKVPTKDILAAVSEDDSVFKPFVDGSFLRAQPRDLFDSGDIADAPYMLGTNANEGSLYKSVYSNVSTEAGYQTVLQENFPADALVEVANAYPKAQYAASKNPYQDALADMFGDARLVCPTLDTAQRAAAAGGNVYVYNFAEANADGSGTPHGAELGYLFGNVGTANAGQSQLATMVQKYWANFATFGDPNDASQTFAWPTYSQAGSRVNLASDLKLITDQHGACAMWSDIYNEPLPVATTPAK